MSDYSDIDLYKSYEILEKVIENDFRAGKIPRERASQILRDARDNYRKRTYIKEMDKKDK